MTDYKQAIVVRDDLDMSQGKSMVQACHAAIGAFKSADDAVVQEWEGSGAAKIALKAEDDDVIEELKYNADRRGLPSFTVRDAGKTELDPGTTTCIGIGPAAESEIDALTRSLTLV